MPELVVLTLLTFADVHGASPAGLALEEAALAALRSINDWPECEAPDDSASTIDEIAARVRRYPVEAGLSLLQLPCSQSAYNQRTVFVSLKRDAEARILKFPSFRNRCCDSADTRPLQTTTERTVPGQLFDSKTQTLFSLVKGRAMGDSGVWMSHRFTNGRFELVSYYEQRICTGEPLGDDYRIANPPPGWTRLRP